MLHFYFQQTLWPLLVFHRLKLRWCSRCSCFLLPLCPFLGKSLSILLDYIFLNLLCFYLILDSLQSLSFLRFLIQFLIKLCLLECHRSIKYPFSTILNLLLRSSLIFDLLLALDRISFCLGGCLLFPLYSLLLLFKKLLIYSFLVLYHAFQLCKFIFDHFILSIWSHRICSRWCSLKGMKSSLRVVYLLVVCLLFRHIYSLKLLHVFDLVIKLLVYHFLVSVLLSLVMSISTFFNLNFLFSAYPENLLL